MNSEALNPEVLKPEVLNAEGLNPQFLTPEFQDPEVLNSKDLNAEMQLCMDLVGPRASCLNTFKYQVNINQLRYVVDIVNVVLTDGFSMDRAGRLEAYEHALSAFQDSQTGLGELSTTMKRLIKRYENAKKFKGGVVGINSITIASQ